LGRLDGRVAIITGGGSGIGKAITYSFAEEGAKVIIAARGVERLTATARDIAIRAGTVVPIQTDVTDEAQVNSLFERAIDLFGRVDILVNNAGAIDGAPLDEMPVEIWDKVIATNLRGPFLCTRSAMRIMKTQGSGRILNIGSISAQRPRANAAPYATSKFGLWGLTLVTALEGRDHGIAACCLHPGNPRAGGLRSVTIEERIEQNVNVESSAPNVADVAGIPGYSSEPKMRPEDVAEVATLMASLPPDMNLLEAIVLPVKQAYLARG
jgi:NAD(P)-dependent dehydrogenase (short-subunit alcohol dehydrogenase family)